MFQRDPRVTTASSSSKVLWHTPHSPTRVKLHIPQSL